MKRLILLFLVSIIILLVTQSSPVHAAKSAGVVDPLNGFPDSYADDVSNIVGACLAGLDPICVLPGAGEEPNFDPNQPTVFPANFPSEFFYWIAESDQIAIPDTGGKFMFRMAVEGAFLNEDPEAGGQMVFGRLRATGNGLVPNSTYTVTHPYGVDTYVTNAVGVMPRNSSTEDIGCEVGPCDFSLALASRVFQSFLRWDVGAPPGYLGDAITAHSVIGSPTGNNFVKIEGPGLPPGGLQTNLFTVSGKLFAGAPPPPPGPGLPPPPPPLPPANVPSGVTALQTAGGVEVRWADTNDNETEFRISRATGLRGAFTQIGTSGANTTLFIDTSAPRGTNFYRVEACNGAGCSPLSTPVRLFVRGTPPVPSGLMSPILARPADTAGGVVLNWRDRSTAETEFRIERRSGVRGVFGQIGTVGADITTFTDPTPPTGLVQYRVFACNGAACSPRSNVAPILRR
ncbi:MAG: fibronectin type III domain-containing protein [Candidatus Daviesbacteria bacterium]|nr:MAG: fibronectin type III domain-containing protein [Candidatus Daviesbacteria bacterium]